MGSDCATSARPRGQAARELRAPGGARRLSRLPLVRPDLVVLASGRDDVRERARRLVLEGTAHLLVAVREATGVVGPLVLPGRTPCLRCLDLTRSDLDPAWPLLPRSCRPPAPATAGCDGPLALAVAAQAAMQVLAMADGTAAPARSAARSRWRCPTGAGGGAAGRRTRDCGCAGPPA